jgi:hypothetical protein
MREAFPNKKSNEKTKDGDDAYDNDNRDQWPLNRNDR